MKAERLLATLLERGALVWAEGGELVCRAPASALDPALRQELGEAKGELLPLLGERRRHAPLSPAQERLWFLQQLAPESRAYHLPAARVLRGRLDRGALERALDQILRRHDVLRATFTTVDDRPCQVVAPPRQLRELPLVDLSGLAAARREDEARRLLRIEADRPFDLALGPPARFLLLRLASAEHVFFRSFHHVVVDAWSQGIWRRELTSLYAAYAARRQAALPELALQYDSFAARQRHELRGEKLDELVAWWRDELEGITALELATDRKRPAVPGYRGAGHGFRVGERLTGVLRGLGRGEGATLYMTLLAALMVLLHRWSGQDDVAVGSPVAGRHPAGVEGLIGFFVNTLVLRGRPCGRLRFRDLLRQVRKSCLAAYAHQELPFEKLVEALVPERDLARSPLFQVLLVLHDAPAEAMALPGLTLSSFELGVHRAPFDLTLALSEEDGVLAGLLSYDTDLFHPTTAARLARSYEILLAGAAEDPERELASLPLLDVAERHQLLLEWNDTALASGGAASASGTVVDAFERQAAATPEAVAAVFDEERLSYHELDERAGRLAAELHRRGVGRDDRVGLFVERSLAMAVAVVGVLKAGAAYVPLDPSYPRERLAFMIEEIEGAVLLTQEALTTCLEELSGDTPAPRPVRPDPESLAYVIYTSGSTGRPKGIALGHRALWNLVAWHLEHLLSAARTLQYASLAFDASFHEMFAAWCSGGTVYLVAEEMRRDMAALARFLAAERIEKAILPVVVLQRLAEEILESGLDLGALRELVTTGEQLHVTAAVVELFQRFPQVAFHNHYGPSETHVVTALRLAGDPRGWPSHPPIGRPIAATEIYLLERRGSPAGLGQVGELLVGGVSLARGYLDRPGRTAEWFVPDPFGDRPGGRLYRTGDHARHLGDGRIEFLGRIDLQVKIRGFRVEPEEVEAVLARHPGVREAAVVVRGGGAASGASEGLFLAGFYVAEGDGPAPPAAALRSFLADRLPEPMVPRLFEELEALPLSPTGKLDRAALGRRVLPAAAGSPSSRPRSAVEEILLAIWEDVLGRSPLGVNDHFFELGGHSLLATQVVSRTRRALGVELPLRRLFEKPTVAELADDVVQQRAASLGRSAPPIVPVERGPEVPLSFAQQRLWFLQQLMPSSSVYNMPGAQRLLGRLNVAALDGALGEIVRRHEALRTRFPATDGRPRQEIATAGTWVLPLVDLTSLPQERRPGEACRRLAAERRRPFQLAVELPLRSHLWRLTAEEHVLFVNIHHIASDGWSQGIFDRELTVLYEAFVEGAPSPLSEPGVQYADFAAWQHEWLRGERLKTHLGYWREHLAGLPVLELPTDRPRPAALTHRGATLQLVLPEELSEGLKRLSIDSGTSLFMTLLAGFLTLLRRLTAQGDLAVGIPIASRHYPEVEELIGLFVNTLVLRGDFSWESAEENPSFGELLSRVREWCLEAYDHQDVPFEKLVEELDPQRSRSHMPLVQVIFQHIVARAPVGLPGLRLSPLGVANQTAKLDLVVNMIDTPEGLVGQWQYSLDLFDATTIGRMKGHFAVLLAASVADPARLVPELPLLSAAEAHQLLAEWNVVTPVPPPTTLHALFAARAAERSAATAVAFGNERLSYGELDRRANQLAHHLRGLGVGRETLVGLFLERSPEMVTAILGVLKAGGAYVPLDPVYPRERIAFLLEDARVPIVITQEQLLESLPGHSAAVLCIDGEWERIRRAPAAAPRVEGSPGELAYVIYTSGSTGKPKGVGVPHAQVVRLLTSTAARFHFDSSDTWTLFHSFAFDFSVWELWGALAFGGRLEVVPYWTSRSPEAFYELVTQAGVTVLNQTPSAFQQFMRVDEATRGGEGPLDLRLVIFGGETLELASLAPWFARHGDERPQLVNMYGITETTVHVTCRPLVRADLEGMPGAPEPRPGSVIGRRISDVSLYVLDQHRQPVPIGIPGEVYVGGAGVARGYLNRRSLTAERFVPDPFSDLPGGRPAQDPAPGTRLYKTGDLARLRPDGDLEYLRRIDHQVKIRGFRVELGEVEENLLRHPAVGEAVVVTRGERPEEMALVAYVVTTAGGDEPTLSKLRSFLAGFLPQYMLPSGLVVLDFLPLTAHGKVDRHALPTPSKVPSEISGEYLAPRNEMERFLTGLWREMLGVDPQIPIGVHDNFFALGGNSIRGAMMVNRLQQKLGEIVQVVTIFDAPTIAELGRYLVEQHPQATQRLFGEKPPGDQAGDRSAYQVVDAQRVAEMRALIPSRPFREPGPKNRPAIFLLAPPRSGTTLLRVMLGGHPALFAPPELELLSFHTLAQRRARFTGRDSFWLEGLTRAVMEIHGCDAQEARHIVERCEAEGLTSQALYGRLQSWLGERRLVDKTPSYALDLEILKRAEACFENALYIHLVRQPYGMIRSFEEAKLDQIFFRTEHPFERRELAELIWLVSQENILRFFEKIPDSRRFRISFEELVSDPQPVMQRLCAFLQLEFDPGMVDPYKERSTRMSDGLHAQSRMLGDVKFHQHERIDASVAERWKAHYEEDFLGRVTWDVAVSLGYPRSAPQAAQVAVPGAPSPRRPESGAPPLSFAQERLWFLQQLTADSAAYNIPVAQRLVGHLDVAALSCALGEVVRRHEALRTLFPAPDGRPCQIIAGAGPWVLPLVDVTALPQERRLDETRCRLTAEARRPFRLAAELPLRSHLWRLAAEEHVLFVNTHHIASDGWSQGIFNREWTVLYEAFVRGAPSPLPEPGVQYADFAVWQREWLRGKVLETQLAYWRRQLDDFQVLELPTDRPRPAVRTDTGASLSLALPEEPSRWLRQLSIEVGASLFMTLLSAFMALLYRLTGQTDLAVGSPIANRRYEEIEGLIGFFVNTLVLRSRPEPRQSFGDLLARVRELCLEAYLHQDLPFEKLVEELDPERDQARSPLFQVMFTVQNAPAKVMRMPGIEDSPFALSWGGSRFDLEVSLFEAKGRIRGSIGYNADLFHATTVARLVRHYETLLAELGEHPERRLGSLSLLAAAERQQLLLEWNDTAAQGAAGPLVSRIEIQTRRTPGAVAATDRTSQLSYGELDARSSRLAHRLVEAGVASEDVVALLAERSVDFLVALLGILKAGGVYLPLDPLHGEGRLSRVLQQSAPRLVLVAGSLEAKLEVALRAFPAAKAPGRKRIEELLANPAPSTSPRVPAASGKLAYVLFTSGSTGRPKGAMITHQGMCNHLEAKIRDLGLGPSDVVAQTASQSFDISVWQLLAPLLAGGRVHVVAPEAARDPRTLLAEVARAGVTILQTVPSFLSLLLDELDRHDGPHPALGRLRWLLSIGEALSGQLARRWLQACPGLPLVNAYGPAECADTVTHRVYVDPLPFATPVTLGRVLPNLRLYLLDKHLEPVPEGAPGELCVAGVGVGRGYLGAPWRTAPSFVPDPFSDHPGGRLYRTGDLGRWRSDGTIEFLGRNDHQVKIRGFRVELGEVEATLLVHPAVAEAAVVAAGEGVERRLVAFVAPGESDTDRPASELVARLREHLAERLPDAMRPTAIRLRASLPRLPSGKVDRKALGRDAREAHATAGTAEFAAPRSPLGKALAEIFSELLHRERIGLHDDFFSLGGHSLLGVVLTTRIEDRFGVRLPLAVLFQEPTLSGLARAISQRTASGGSPLIALRDASHEPPFFCVHPAGGGVLCYAELARHLGPDRPFYALEARGYEGDQLPHDELPAMAADYLTAIRERCGESPRWLAGWSFGGVVAFEMARQLRRESQEAPGLILIDSPAPGLVTPDRDEAELLGDFARHLGLDAAANLRGPQALGRIHQLGLDEGLWSAEVDLARIERYFRLYRANLTALERYSPRPYDCRMTLFRAQEDLGGNSEPTAGWDSFADEVEVRIVPGDHFTMMKEPRVRALAEQLRRYLERGGSG